VNRRQFLKTAAAGPVAGLAATRRTYAQNPPVTLHTRTMGATGIEVVDIGLGSNVCGDDAVMRYALDMGMNYIDTARAYRDGNAERMVAEAVAGRPRDSFVICDKVPWYATTAEDMLAEANTALELLRLDYVDFMLYHKMDAPEQFTQEFVDVAKQLKAEGKTRYFGVSTHIQQVAVARRAIELGVDQILLGFGVAGVEQYAELESVINEAAAKGIAVAAMKTASGQDQPTIKAFQDEGLSFFVACLKWALSNPNVCVALSEITTLQMADENVAASGGRLTEGEHAAIERFVADRGRRSFVYWGAAQAKCANGVAVAEILRHRAYYVEYGERALARKLYSSLPDHQRPAACPGCPVCDTVRTELREAERYLA